MKGYNGIIERYRERLPIGRGTRIVSLCEGDTPLLRLHHIPSLLGKDIALYVKYEGLNPTGSFKDRGMTMAVTKALEDGSRAILCASTGNTSASAAAYAARAGIRAFVLIPEGKIALGKLAQAILHGALVMQIQGNFDLGMRLVKDVAVRLPVTLVNSVNPYRLEGQKTAAFEVIEALGRAPDFHCLPVGNAGNITAYWMGYREYHGHGLVEGLPRMCGFQASGAAPFVRGHPIDHPETVATAIQIGHPQSWDLALQAQAESDGWFDELSDTQILAAQRLLAEQEGIFCEPASAASIAGAMRDVTGGKIPERSLVVCTLTGHGLKDPDIAIAQSSAPPLKIEARLTEVERVIAEEIGG
ncbi:MAG: threonine synthase [Gammaproteobacteria bacterium]